MAGNGEEGWGRMKTANAKAGRPSSDKRAGRVRESIFRLPNKTRKEWIYKQEKALPLPFYATFGMAAPTLRRQCARCGQEHGPGNRCILGQMDDPNGVEPCQYALCTTKGTHALKVCMLLNNRCTRCLYRGHQKNGRCGWVGANLEIFKN
jgi:hypothetical protein